MSQFTSNTQTNNTKEMVSMNNTIKSINNIDMNKAVIVKSASDNVLRSRASVLDALIEQPGFRKGGVNLNKLLAAMVAGSTIESVLAEPVKLADVAPTQAHHFKKALDAMAPRFPKTFRAPQRLAVQNMIIDLAHCEAVRENGKLVKVVSKFNYDNPASLDANSGYAVQSQSALADTMSAEGLYTLQHYVEADKHYMVTERTMKLMHNVVYVNLKLEAEEGDDLSAEQLEIQAFAMDHGITIMRDGVELTAHFFMQTASQARLVQGIFLITENEAEEIPAAFTNLAHELLIYAKKKTDKEGGVFYEIDMSKAPKRPGLAGTSSTPIRTFSVGKATHVEEHENGEYTVNFEDGKKIRYIHDRVAYVRQGKFKCFDPATKTLITLDASEYPIQLTVGDGQYYYGPSIYNMITAETNVDVDAVQTRIVPSDKGLGVYIEDLNNYYDADIVVPFSVAKGDHRLMSKDALSKIELRIALFNKKTSNIKTYTKIPYQFLHGIAGMTEQDLYTMVKPHVEKAKSLLSDPEALAEYLGMDGFDIEEADEAAVDRAMVSTLTQVLAYAPGAIKDMQMQKYIVEHIREMIKDWVHGSIPVRANYKFMVQDPYAILSTQPDANGEYVVPENRGIRPGNVVIKDAFDRFVEGPVGLLRNPMISKREAAYGIATPNAYYKNSKHFRNMAIFSCHDFLLFKQGGADCDGDKTLVIFDQIIVSKLAAVKDQPAILDLVVQRENGKAGKITGFSSGCPYTLGKEQVEFDAECISVDGYKVRFTLEQYNAPGFVFALHKLSKHYIKKTLKPNQIGALTNYATKLADAVSAMEAMIRDGKGNRVNLEAEIAKYEDMIDLLRLLQGWEIDAAKHGGAFWDVLKDELSFIVNPPARVGKWNKKKERMEWADLDWMRSLKGKEPNWKTISSGSMISNFFATMNKWYAKLEEQVLSLNKDTNIENELVAAIPMTVERRDEIVAHIKPIYLDYTIAVAKAIQKKNAMDAQASGIYSDEQELAKYMDRAQRAFNDEIQLITDASAANLHVLEQAYSAEEIGYAAYFLTYNVNKDRKAVSFAWRAAKRQVLAAAAVAFGTRTTRLPKINTEIQGEVKFNFAYTAAFDGNKVALRLNQLKQVDVVFDTDAITGNAMYFVEVAGTRIGHVFAQFTGLFAGTKRATVSLNEIKFNGKGSMLTMVTGINKQ